jgi:hypothetical protein
MAFRLNSIRLDLEEDAYLLFGFLSGAGKVWMEGRLRSGLLPYRAIIDPPGDLSIVGRTPLLPFAYVAA